MRARRTIRGRPVQIAETSDPFRIREPHAEGDPLSDSRVVWMRKVARAFNRAEGRKSCARKICAKAAPVTRMQRDWRGAIREALHIEHPWTVTGRRMRPAVRAGRGGFFRRQRSGTTAAADAAAVRPVAPV